MSRQTRATTVVSQPREVVNGVRVGSAEPKPCLLDGVVGLVARPEHSQRNRPKVLAVGFKALGK